MLLRKFQKMPIFVKSFSLPLQQAPPLFDDNYYGTVNNTFESMTSCKFIFPEFFSDFAYCFNRFFFSHSLKRISFLSHTVTKLVPQSFSVYCFFCFHNSSPLFQEYYLVKEMSRQGNGRCREAANSQADNFSRSAQICSKSLVDRIY